MLNSLSGFIKNNLPINITYFAICLLTAFVSLQFTGKEPGLLLVVVVILHAFITLNFGIKGSESIRNKGENVSQSISSLFKPDKEIIFKAIILGVFLAAIFMILKGPLVLIAFTPLQEKAVNYIQNNQTALYVVAAISVIWGVIYQVFVVSSLATAIYFRGDTLESLKNGIKITLKSIYLIIFLLLIAGAEVAIFKFLKDNVIVAFTDSLINLLITPLILLLAFIHIKRQEEPITEKLTP